MDGVHARRDRVGADLVHFVVGESDVGGIANGPASSASAGGVVSRTSWDTTWGLDHDRHQAHHYEGGVSEHPAYGYVNQHAFEPGAPPSTCWGVLE